MLQYFYRSKGISMHRMCFNGMYYHPDPGTNCSANYVTYICPNSWAISGSHTVTNSESYCSSYGSAQRFTDNISNGDSYCCTDSSSLDNANRVA
jgi:hypothetical protein